MNDIESTNDEIQRAIERSERAMRRVSPAGRDILAAAVQIDHDWSLRFSSEDKLSDALTLMSGEDLEAATLLVQYLESAITSALIRRDMARDADSRDGAS